jgi:hypothetical protein
VVQRFLPAWILRVRLIALLTQTLEEWFGLTDLRSYVVDESSRAWFPDRTLNTQRTLNNLLTIHSIARGHGARTIFSTVQIFDGADFDAPSMANGPQSRSEMFRRFFETNGFLYVDQDRLIPDGDRSIQVDPVHFTAKGSMMMARNYFDYIVAKDLIPE